MKYEGVVNFLVSRGQCGPRIDDIKLPLGNISLVIVGRAFGNVCLTNKSVTGIQLVPLTLVLTDPY